MSRLNNHNRMLDISRTYNTSYISLSPQQQQDVLETLSSVEDLFLKQPYEAGTTEYEMVVAAILWQLCNNSYQLIHPMEMTSWMLRNQLSKATLEVCLHGGVTLYWEGVQLCVFQDTYQAVHFMNLHHFKVTGIEVDYHLKLTMTFSD